MPWKMKESQTELHWFPYTTVAFIVGAATSMISGYIGMKIATIANYKTTAACSGKKEDHSDGQVQGFKVAFMGG